VQRAGVTLPVRWPASYAAPPLSVRVSRRDGGPRSWEQSGAQGCHGGRGDDPARQPAACVAPPPARFSCRNGGPGAPQQGVPGACESGMRPAGSHSAPQVPLVCRPALGSSPPKLPLGALTVAGAWRGGGSPGKHRKGFGWLSTWLDRPDRVEDGGDTTVSSFGTGSWPIFAVAGVLHDLLPRVGRGAHGALTSAPRPAPRSSRAQVTTPGSSGDRARRGPAALANRAQPSPACSTIRLKSLKK
jgi:hypothetical protein